MITSAGSGDSGRGVSKTPHVNVCWKLINWGCVVRVRRIASRKRGVGRLGTPEFVFGPVAMSDVGSIHEKCASLQNAKDHTGSKYY
jgi:hypothetical protein